MTKIDTDDGQKMWIDYVNEVGKDVADQQLANEMECCRNELIHDEISDNWYLRAWHSVPIDKISGIKAEEMVRLTDSPAQDLIDILYKRNSRLMVMYKAGKVKTDGSL